jgi:hypothetical protein
LKNKKKQVRFLGNIAGHVRSANHEYGPVAHRFLMVEMCARVLKVFFFFFFFFFFFCFTFSRQAILRQKLRDTMQLYRVPLEQP